MWTTIKARPAGSILFASNAAFAVAGLLTGNWLMMAWNGAIAAMLITLLD